MRPEMKPIVAKAIEILQGDVESRLDAIAEDTALWFDITKDQAKEWLRETLTGEADPIRRFG